MKYKITKHAQINADERRISVKDIVDCLKFPEQKVPSRKNRTIYQKIKKWNGEKKLLRLIVSKKQKECLKIVTVYVTSKIEKYWEKD